MNYEYYWISITLVYLMWSNHEAQTQKVCLNGWKFHIRKTGLIRFSCVSLRTHKQKPQQRGKLFFTISISSEDSWDCQSFSLWTLRVLFCFKSYWTLKLSWDGVTNLGWGLSLIMKLSSRTMFIKLMIVMMVS